MNELLAGYANYASTEAVLHESHIGNSYLAPDTSTCSVTVTWTYTIIECSVSYTV